MTRLRTFWFGEVDLAPVALFRILYGLQLFNWFWQLLPNLNAFFTDEESGTYTHHLDTGLKIELVGDLAGLRHLAGGQQGRLGRKRRGDLLQLLAVRAMA